ncbi:trypsin-like serine protease [Micromonospora sp. NBC_01740]|uniref:trypsin-like serine protease n=1 Tax=Micromonospora sp. NBC_01740 TaxID=2975986 RepID=UPI002E117FC8|nr:trypsin-like serine protease [Micromonospora sp. NBC_01740]
MPSSYRRRTARIAGLLATALLAGLLGVSPAQAVTGGAAVSDGSFAFAAKIEVGPGLKACSGALVDPWWVLTAKSCFSVDGQPVVAGTPAKPATVTVGRSDLTASSGAVVPVFRIVPHPNRDVVLVRLAARVDAAPVPLGAAPTVGEQLTVAGFGRTATTWVPDQLHTGTFAVQGVNAGTLAILGSGQAAICRGDLGGPTVRMVNGQPQLVALHHTSWQGGCLAETETRREAVETRVDDLGSWLTANIPQGPALDQYEDINFLYVYATGDGAPQTFPATSTGAFTAPLGEWSGGNGAYKEQVKVFNDDFDGDGVRDVAVMSKRAGGNFYLDTFITRPDGKYSAPIRSWTDDNFGHMENMKMASGDFNGDGRTDLTAFYGYANGDEGWFNWIARPDGGFEEPVEVWKASNFGSWTTTSVFAGDVNGDGRDDASLFYRYNNSTAMALITWPGKADGTFGTGYTSWSTPNSAPFTSLTSMKVVDGDFNGDGRDDVAVLLNDNGLRLFTWIAKADGNFEAPLASWTSTIFGQFARIKIVSGDYNGDKRDDLAVLYQYPSDGIGLHTFTAKTDGGFNPPVQSWTVGPAEYGWWPSMRLHGQ